MGKGCGWGRQRRQTRIGLEFLSAEISNIVFQTKLDLVWNLFPSKFGTFIFQTKLDLVWKYLSIFEDNFPNQTGFGLETDTE